MSCKAQLLLNWRTSTGETLHSCTIQHKDRRYSPGVANVVATSIKINNTKWVCRIGSLTFSDNMPWLYFRYSFGHSCYITWCNEHRGIWNRWIVSVLYSLFTNIYVDLDFSSESIIDISIIEDLVHRYWLVGFSFNYSFLPIRASYLT